MSSWKGSIGNEDLLKRLKEIKKKCWCDLPANYKPRYVAANDVQPILNRIAKRTAGKENKMEQKVIDCRNDSDEDEDAIVVNKKRVVQSRRCLSSSSSSEDETATAAAAARQNIVVIDDDDDDDDEELVVKVATTSKKRQQRHRQILQSDSEDSEDEKVEATRVLDFGQKRTTPTRTESKEVIVIDDDDDDEEVVYGDDDDMDVDMDDLEEEEEEYDEEEDGDDAITKQMKQLNLAKSPAKSKIEFINKRDELTRSIFHRLNQAVFDNRLPEDLEITWSNRLNKTAGITSFNPRKEPKINGLNVSIQLATKVVDDQKRLRNTLCHELCHAAAWIIDGVRKPPHGPTFQKWANVAASTEGIAVGTCHNYQINYKHVYECTNPTCSATYGRHSKSIDIARFRCGRCRGELRLQPKLRKDGTPCKARTPSAYNRFVQEQSALLRMTEPGISGAEIMTRVGILWRQEKSKN